MFSGYDAVSTDNIELFMDIIERQIREFIVRTT